MPVTIGGAVRHKKLYIGKQVRVLGDGEQVGKVLDVQGDTLRVELFAVARDVDVKLQAGEQVSLGFVVPGDASYRFLATVESIDEVRQTLLLRQAEPIVRTEQRSDYRIQTSKVIYVADPKAKRGMEENWQQAGLLDISRSGASILTPLQVVCGEKLKVWIPLDEVDHILETETQVVRVSAGDDGLCTAGLNFNEMPLADQGKVLDYIMEVWKKKKDGKEQSE